MCLFKAIPNLLISASFPFWICPLSFLEYTIIDLPRFLNISIAEFIGLFCYYFASLILICMSLNRFMAIYFPLRKVPSKIPYSNLSILVCFVFASGPVFVPKFFDCFFIYDPELGIFLSEDVNRCGKAMDSFVIYSIPALAVISNGFNAIIFGKLVKDKMTGISENQKQQRRMKWKAMYIQTVIQDFLPVLDIINFNLISGLIISSLWYFIFSTLSFVCIYAIDGAVMMFFYTDFGFYCCGGKGPKKSITFVSGVQNA
ncbi:Protein CBR-SRX-134 [Caenorhabditis briggsae]|uniref:Protein CBR-SRX-134 n=1 Tax=Caenorhabditis briggsae TaxID=6238 RepID=A8XCY5_CAEBR|nr:Protein CBR-SRX-134 [Caenorhabditis briggsae]CAP30503.2 Protein CBR-SRX-134 [Caenorhabditis briggsae]